MATPLLPEIADLDTFGGTFADLYPVIDPTTDMAAADQNNLTANVVAMSHTAPRAWARCTISGGVITLADHDAVWGNGAGVAPTAARSSAGVYTVTWAASYDDLRAVDDAESHAVSLRCSQANGYKSGAARIVNVRLSSVVIAAVTAFDAAGSAAELDEFTVTVW